MAFVLAEPKDWEKERIPQGTYIGNFRFKGFPNNNFIKASVPRTISPPHPIEEGPSDPAQDTTEPQLPPQPPSPVKSVGSPTKSLKSPTKSLPKAHTFHAQESKMQEERQMSSRSSRGGRGDSARDFNGYETDQRPISRSYQQPPPQHLSNSKVETDMMDGNNATMATRQDSFHALNQGRSYDYDTNRSVPKLPIRNAQEKTEDEIRKLEQQFLDREEDQHRLNMEHQRQQEERRMQQQRDLEMLKNYDPYGKPGVGAPRDDNRKQKFTEEQLYRSEEPRYKYPPDRYLPSDSSMLPPKDRRKYYEAERQQYSQRMMNEQNHNMARDGLDDMPPFPSSPGRQSHLYEQRAKIDRAREEIEELKRRKAEMFGDGYYNNRPLGPPIRRKLYNSWDVQEMKRVQARASFQRSLDEPPNNMEYTNRSTNGRSDSYNPWGKGVGNPERDVEGNVMRKPQQLGKTTKSLPTEYGEHYRNNPEYKSPENPTNKPAFNRFDNLGRVGKASKPNMEPSPPIYHPFGKAGGGAPNKDMEGKITTQIKGYLAGENYLKMSEEEMMRKKMNQRAYNEELGIQTQEQRRNKEEMDRHLRQGTTDMVNIMSNLKVGKMSQGNHHLPNSDVTRTKMNKPDLAPAWQREYHNDLETLNNMRKAKEAQEKLRNLQQDRMHQNTFDSYFHSNTMDKQNRKRNLDLILNRPSDTVKTSDLYIKSKDWSYVDGQPFKQDDYRLETPAESPDNSPRHIAYDDSVPRVYPRTTVNSNHANMYDYPWQQPLEKKEYHHVTPYATYGNTSIM